MFEWMIEHLDTVLVIVRVLEALTVIELVKLIVEIWREK